MSKTVRNLPTDRYRGPHTFVETRTAAYYGRMGYLAGLGRPSLIIAAQLGDGIHPSTVRKTLNRWGIAPGDGNAWCQVPLSPMERAWLIYRAEKEGVSPEEWLRRRVAAAINPS